MLALRRRAAFAAVLLNVAAGSGVGCSPAANERPAVAATRPAAPPTATATAPAPAPATTPSAADPSFPIDTSKAWILHVPGIAGESVIDHTLFDGIRDGGFAGLLELYDWTGIRRGISALVGRERNDAEAQKVADRIVARRRADPNGQIVLTGHSGGSGIIVFALEKLPPGVTVDSVLLLAPALSPDYDLSAALSRVRGRAYVFSSTLDLLVLGLGTRVFGTIDRKQGESAGRVGFKRPPGADAAQYAKLVPCPYERAWVRYGNIGDHVSVMSRPFSRSILFPLIRSNLPGSPGPLTRPTTMATTRPAP